MLRMLMLPVIGAALLSAFMLYTVNYQTRAIDEENQRIESETQGVSRDIAILRAERAYLMRPDRIEPLARSLGMAPIEGRQFMLQSELQAPRRRP